jgi:hypothetical protein
MYGTVFRMRAKAGREPEVRALFDEWWRERAPAVRGAQAGYVFQPEGSPGEWIGVVVFADRESYRANAEDPAQDRWYRRLREALEADPAWEDGPIVSGYPAG